MPADYDIHAALDICAVMVYLDKRISLEESEFLEQLHSRLLQMRSPDQMTLSIGAVIGQARLVVDGVIPIDTYISYRLLGTNAADVLAVIHECAGIDGSICAQETAIIDKVKHYQQRASAKS